MQTLAVKLSDIKPNTANPRTISKDKLDKLVNSIKSFPEMRDVREIVVNKDMVILGGNMRYQAMMAAGLTETTVKIVDWTEAKQKEFIIKDNIESGDWNYDTLANEWDAQQLNDWGLDMSFLNNKEDETYTKELGDIHYKPSDTKPGVENLYDRTKADALIKELEQLHDDAQLPDDVFNFLILAAGRHIVFDYAKIADFYAHSPQDIQKLFEKSALVLIDYNNAINNGYVELSKKIIDLQNNEHAPT